MLFRSPKTYFVKASKVLSDEQLERLRRGIELRDGMTRPAIVERIGKSTFSITITEGRNRQVRRMVEALDAKVEKLVRTAIGGVEMGELASGRLRELTPEEIRSLKAEQPR